MSNLKDWPDGFVGRAPSPGKTVRRLDRLGILLFGLVLCTLSLVAATNVWCPHVSHAAGWKTSIAVYSPATWTTTFQLTKYAENGTQLEAPSEESISPGTWVIIPDSEFDYEGSADIASTDNLLVKAMYQFGDSPSVCEFYLNNDLQKTWKIPNSVRSWMDYTGLSVVNSNNGTAMITLEAWNNGVKVATSTPVVSLSPHAKHVRLTEGIWPGIGYTDLDTIRVISSLPIPPPISITGNNAGDRHLFFRAEHCDQYYSNDHDGDLITYDSIVGNLRFTPWGTFRQGSPGDEPGREADEDQFPHTLTYGLAVMETEVTRQMWADLRALVPQLPADPSDTAISPTLQHPVQYVTWYEAVLFANVLSTASGYGICYYLDAGFTVPVTTSNYNTGGTVYWKPGTSAYRLPTEGEWESFCRAGRVGVRTPFSAAEWNYQDANCNTCSPSPSLGTLSNVAWWCYNSNGKAQIAGQKDFNSWNLRDVHGNVREWCWDWYGAYPSSWQTDYTGPSTGTYKVARGGSWNDVAWQLRSANRHTGNPNGRGRDLGFRLVRTLFAGY
jgi:formylglycine-generating enzyme required for sulfatase activity